MKFYLVFVCSVLSFLSLQAANYLEPYFVLSKKSSKVKTFYLSHNESTLQHRVAVYVSGVVKDDNGDVLPGVSIKLKGSNSVTQTNGNGAFKFSIPELLMSGGAIGSEDNEDWVVSKQLDPNFIKSDVGFILKNISAPRNDFNYKYTKEGVYKASFLASNMIGKSSKEVIKEFTITVTK